MKQSQYLKLHHYQSISRLQEAIRYPQSAGRGLNQLRHSSATVKRALQCAQIPPANAYNVHGRKLDASDPVSPGNYQIKPERPSAASDFHWKMHQHQDQKLKVCSGIPPNPVNKLRTLSTDCAA